MTAKKGIPVFIETNILIWAVRKDSAPGQEDMIVKAQNLVEHLAATDAKLQTSTICLGEFLTGIHNDKHAALTRIIQSGFQLYPYDAVCAMKAAWLYRLRAKTLKSLAEQNAEAGRRVKLKNDVMIVATALVHGSSVIYTNDDDIKKIAGDLIEVKMLSDYTVQYTAQEELFTPAAAAAH